MPKCSTELPVQQSIAVQRGHVPEFLFYAMKLKSYSSLSAGGGLESKT